MMEGKCKKLSCVLHPSLEAASFTPLICLAGSERKFLRATTILGLTWQSAGWAGQPTGRSRTEALAESPAGSTSPHHNPTS